MNRTNSTKFVLLLAMITCILAFVCGCKIQILDKGDSSDVTGRVESTEQQTQNPNLTPTPASVYIPREELPGGRLFEEGYYAVLPGEGAYYNVFDGYGTLVDSFYFSDAESAKPTGLHTEKDLSVYHRLNDGDVQTIVPEKEDEYENNLISYENGFYQKSNKGTWATLILYNKEGKHIATLTSPFDANDGWVDIVVKSFGEETVVSFSSEEWDSANDTTVYSTVIYFIAYDGTIQSKCEAYHLTNKPIELLARKYFLVFLGDWDTQLCDLVDFEGNIIKEDVLYFEDSLQLYSGESVTNIYISDYFIKDGQVYNASFQPVEKNSTQENGKLIYSLEYEVQGITCKALYGKESTFFWSYGDEELVAVGTLDDQIAIKTQGSEYVFARNGFSYYAMNAYVLVLTNGYGSFQVVSLETGEVLNTIDNSQNVQVTDEYLLVGSIEHGENGWPQVQYIIDKNGNVRYYADNAIIRISVGEYIILNRGPYQGIADLNGDWIMKTLTWEMTRDDVYVDPWA